MTDQETKPPTGRDHFRQLSVYLTADMLARLDRIATKEKRSMSNLINFFLDDAIPAYWLAKGQPEPKDEKGEVS
jgi:hypothetical protein